MKERLVEDLKLAMKSQDKMKLSVIRMVKAAIQMDEISKKRELNDDEVVSIIAKQIKTRKESIQEFMKANRTDLVEQNETEIEILNAYMPKMMEASEIEAILTEVFARVNPTNTSDIGRIMKEVAPLVKGKADMSLVNSLIKNRLENL